MFDIGFTELIVISVVALVVIGPERLPTVARTVGALLGRLNRYVSDVKADVEREMRLDEMKKLRAEVEAQASGIERQVVDELEATRAAATQPVAEINQSLADVMHETGNVNDATQQAMQAVTTAGVLPGELAPESGAGTAPVVAAAPTATDAGVVKA